MGKKKLLQDELEQVEYKLNCEMNWFRQEIAPLKNRKKELLEELKNKEALEKYSDPLSGKNLPFSSLSDKIDKKKE